QPDGFVLAERTGRKSDISHDALVGVVMRIEDQALEWRAWIAEGCRDSRDDGLQDFGYSRALLGRREDDLLARDGQNALQFVHHELGLRGGEVDLVEDGH